MTMMISNDGCPPGGVRLRLAATLPILPSRVLNVGAVSRIEVFLNQGFISAINLSFLILRYDVDGDGDGDGINKHSV